MIFFILKFRKCSNKLSKRFLFGSNRDKEFSIVNGKKVLRDFNITIIHNVMAYITISSMSAKSGYFLIHILVFYPPSIVIEFLASSNDIILL